MADGEVSRLVLARVLLREAERFVDHDNPSLQSLALLPLQDAVELVLGVLATVRKAKMEAAFEKSIDSVEKVVGVLPLHQRMLALNKARVNLKHYGVPTDRDAVRSFAQEAGTFIREATRQLLDLAFDDVSIADIIRNPKVSREVRRAEQHFGQAEYEACAIACAIGFAYLTERLATDPRWTRRLSTSGLRSHGYHEDGKITKLKESVADALETLQAHSRLFGLLASGVDLSDYWHFAALTPQVSIQRGNASVYGQRGPLTPRQARFCLDYLINTALSVQGTRGGVFTEEATSLRVRKDAELLACVPVGGRDPDVVAHAHPGEILVYDGRLTELTAGEIIPVIHLSTSARLWIDAGALEFVKSPRHESPGEDSGPPTE